MDAFVIGISDAIYRAQENNFAELAPAMKSLLDYVRKKYAEVDIDQTSATAYKR